MARTAVAKRRATCIGTGGIESVKLSEVRFRARFRGTGRTVARGVIFVIQLYRHMISPLRPAACRFVPTCSQYAVDALSEYGVIRGGWLAVARLAKCGPWHRGGWDPIPERRTERTPQRSRCRADAEDASHAWGPPAKQGESEPFVL